MSESVTDTGRRAPRLQGLHSWLDDRMPPIVLKELRQAAQGRFLSSIVLTLVLVQLGVLSMVLLNEDLDGASMVAQGGFGKPAFGGLVVVLMVLGGLGLPIYAAVRFLTERRGDGLSLLFISTLSPRRIVLGKVISNLLLGGMMVSLCLPYLAFTYFLRGISLLAMGQVFLVLALCMGCAVVLAIFLASLPAERMALILLMAVGTVALLWWFIFCLILAVSGIDRGDVMAELGSSMSGTFFVLAALVVAGLLFVLSVAMISPAVSNRARPVRLYIVGVWLCSGGALSWFINPGAAEVTLRLWLYGFIGVFCAGMLVASSAPDRLSRRLREELPSSRLRRLVTFMLSSGSANGMLWGMAGTIGTVLWFLVMVRWNQAPSQSFLATRAGGFGAYIFAYSLLAVFLQRKWLRPLKRSQTWALTLMLIVLGSLLPPLVLALVTFGQGGQVFEEGYWLLFNPFAVNHHVVGDVVATLGGLLALLMAYLSYGWGRRQWLDYMGLGEDDRDALRGAADAPEDPSGDGAL